MLRRSALALAVAASLVVAVPQAAQASDGWLIRCPLSHSASNDPVVFPGQPGASHLHDFFGNRSTDAYSTYPSMTAGATTCQTPTDTAGYWTPALYRNGVKVDPAGTGTRQQIYYRDNNVTAGTHVTAFPPDFRMVFGSSHATTLTEANAAGAKIGSEIYWGCSNNSESGKPTAPVDCSTGIITLHVQFPNCWNGVQSGGNEIAAGNVVFPKSSACPATHPTVLPRLIERFEYPVGTSSSGITLASGNVYSVHADFWNTWDQRALQALVDRCLNGGTDCGTDPATSSTPSPTPTPTTPSPTASPTTPTTEPSPTPTGC